MHARCLLVQWTIEKRQWKLQLSYKTAVERLREGITSEINTDSAMHSPFYHLQRRQNRALHSGGKRKKGMANVGSTMMIRSQEIPLKSSPLFISDVFFPDDAENVRNEWIMNAKVFMREKKSKNQLFLFLSLNSNVRFFFWNISHFFMAWNQNYHYLDSFSTWELQGAQKKKVKKQRSQTWWKFLCTMLEDNFFLCFSSLVFLDKRSKEWSSSR